MAARTSLIPEGMTRESARIEAMIQKSKVIKQWDKVEAKAALKAESAGNTYEGAVVQAATPSEPSAYVGL